MDANWVRSLSTLQVFVSFILVIYTVFNRRSKKNYDGAADGIFDNSDDNMSDKNGR